MNDNQDNITTAGEEAPDMVNHPPHYTNGPDLGTLECIDITRWMPFTLGNAFKYVWRAGAKGGPDKAIEDLEKAKFYLNEWVNYSGAPFPRESQAAVYALLRKARPALLKFFPEWKAEALRYILEPGVFVAFDYIEKGIAAYKYMRDETDDAD